MSMNDDASTVASTENSFIDQEFPPQFDSLVPSSEMDKVRKVLDKQSKKMEKFEYWKDIKWMTPSQIASIKGVPLFPEKVSPNDVKQGALGDCYFLSTLASLATQEELIKALFVTKEANPKGLYTTRFLQNGIPIEVTIDDSLPCRYKQLYFSSSDTSLWVMLLEKAWAKSKKSYSGIINGTSLTAFHDLTGAPTRNEKYDDYDDVWSKITEGLKKKHLMTTGTHSDEPEHKMVIQTMNDQGLIEDHSYSLLDAQMIGNDRILKLRNPWGKTEWKGDWSSSSKLWPKDIRANFLKDSDEKNGIFWVSLKDAAKFFHSVSVCMVEAGSKMTSVQSQSNPGQFHVFKIQINSAGKQTFQIVQADQRDEETKEKGERYSRCRVILYEAGGQGKVNYVAGAYSSNRISCLEVEDLKAQTYFAYVEVLRKEKTPDLKFAFGAYGSPKITISEEKPSQSKNELLCQIFEGGTGFSEKTYEGCVLVRKSENSGKYRFTYNEYINQSSEATVFVSRKANKLTGFQVLQPEGQSFDEKDKRLILELKPLETKQILLDLHGSIELHFTEKTIVRWPETSIIAKCEAKESTSIGSFQMKRLLHDFGAFLILTNDSSEKTVESKVKFNLSGIELKDQLGVKDPTIEVKLKPGDRQDFVFVNNRTDFETKKNFHISASSKTYNEKPEEDGVLIEKCRKGKEHIFLPEVVKVNSFSHDHGAIFIFKNFSPVKRAEINVELTLKGIQLPDQPGETSPKIWIKIDPGEEQVVKLVTTSGEYMHRKEMSWHYKAVKGGCRTFRKAPLDEDELRKKCQQEEPKVSFNGILETRSIWHDFGIFKIIENVSKDQTIELIEEYTLTGMEYPSQPGEKSPRIPIKLAPGEKIELSFKATTYPPKVKMEYQGKILESRIY